MVAPFEALCGFGWGGNRADHRRLHAGPRPLPACQAVRNQSDLLSGELGAVANSGERLPTPFYIPSRDIRSR
jgi:hypothetical protein